MSQPDTKRLRESSDKIIGTHDGTFHCDEALAVFLLRQTTRYHDAGLVRTRDQEILKGCTIVVDVGAVFDADGQRFDHHQREFNEVFGYGHKTKLSSAGLIFKYFGKEIISQRLQVPAEEGIVHTLFLKLYKEFIEAIDGIDNGVSQYPPSIEPAYRSRTDLSSRVSWLNPAWNEASDRGAVDARFLKASQLTGSEFLNRLDYYAKSWLPAREIVMSAIEKRAEVNSSRLIILFEKFAPWKEHLFDIEAELELCGSSLPLYVVYPDETGGNWRIQAIPENPDTFANRKPLPSEWRGLRDDTLSQKTGIPDCIFVHSSGFIGGNRTKAGALQMATLALQL